MTHFKWSKALLCLVYLVSCSRHDPKQFLDKIYASEKVKHFEFDNIFYDTLSVGIFRKLVYGDNLQQTDVVIKKGYIIPKHEHISEQMSTILEGAFKATIYHPNRTEVVILNTGDVFFIPSPPPS
ncbi:cupin domain-containing protein [Aquimarina algicola]|uniref:Cupin domain-containing protein n=1 Tax=Aquimarina algicola TaxID=2589995 RepID=A0A504IWL2_9FLAO|nr:hypothetical protein [Aquimarina algicola]TPN82766.1 hypothetical protein FHK87_20270 [Aquimarina algicola]